MTIPGRRFGTAVSCTAFPHPHKVHEVPLIKKKASCIHSIIDTNIDPVWRFSFDVCFFSGWLVFVNNSWATLPSKRGFWFLSHGTLQINPVEFTRGLQEVSEAEPLYLGWFMIIFKAPPWLHFAQGNLLQQGIRQGCEQKPKKTRVET